MSETMRHGGLRALYDDYPTPLREPQDERRRLVIRPMESLAQINHFVFAGRQSFGPGTRILAAGAGTGDEVLYLAEQLRERGGELTYLDSSAAALDVCQRRAVVRGLDNILFRHGLIEELDPETDGRFDYVHCIDTLTQLADPLLGLRRLSGLLTDTGGIGLLVKAPLGIRGDLAVGQLSRMLSPADSSLRRLHLDGLAVVATLPPEHPFFDTLPRDQAMTALSADPGQLLERILTPEGAALTVPEIHDLAEACDLTVIEFVPANIVQPVFTLFYNPDFYILDPQLSGRIAALPLRDRRAMAELLNGAMGSHGLYCGRGAAREALPTDDAMIPTLALTLSSYRIVNQMLVVTDYQGRRYEFEAPPSINLIFHLIDGERTIGEIVADGNRRLQEVGLPAVDLLTPFLQLFSNLRNFGWVTLRHKSVKLFARLDHLYFAEAGWVAPPKTFE